MGCPFPGGVGGVGGGGVGGGVVVGGGGGGDPAWLPGEVVRWCGGDDL